MPHLIECQSCKGKGHIFNPLWLLCVVAIPSAIFGRNNRNNHTRVECEQCDGRGYIRL